MRILPIFISHLGCPFKCVYCNQFHITKSKGINISEIVQQIKNYSKYKTEGDEIAFYGGTFTGLKIDLQEELLQIANKFAPNTAIRISTRPDFIDKNILNFLKKYNVQTIELGIQSFYNDVLRASQRGYSAQTAIRNCNMIKDYNFKLSIQLMPGLPAFSQKSLQYSIEQTIKISPEFVRIYPTVVLKDTELEKKFIDGTYKPLSLEEAINITAKMMIKFKENKIKVIKSGLHSDISDIVAGPYHQSFGELVKSEIYYRQLKNCFQKTSTLNISNKDISLFTGFGKRLLKKIKNDFKVEQIRVNISDNLDKNDFFFSDTQPTMIW